MRLNRSHVIAGRRCVVGVVGPSGRISRTRGAGEKAVVSGTPLAGVAGEGESPVPENVLSSELYPK